MLDGIDLTINLLTAEV